jgi:hypothetical protein
VTTSELLGALWRDYTARTPSAGRIHRLLLERGEVVHHDHLAVRTFDTVPVDLAAIARPFEQLGWRPRDRYRLEAEHLRARYWQDDDPNLPKLFVSEVAVAELSPPARAIVARLVAQVREPAFLERGWQVTFDDYERLRAENEHAAWVAAFGTRVEHFTIDVGALTSFPDVAALVAFLGEHGFVVAFDGGFAPDVAQRFEQAATAVDPIVVAFTDRNATIASCAYRFARRAVQLPVKVAK